MFVNPTRPYFTHTALILEKAYTHREFAIGIHHIPDRSTLILFCKRDYFFVSPYHSLPKVLANIDRASTLCSSSYVTEIMCGKKSADGEGYDDR
jgi:hypothetical protein